MSKLWPVVPVKCERCGGPVNLAGRENIDGYLYTGRCERCRVNVKPGPIGMIENILEVR